MMALLLTVCMIGAPDKCREERVPLTGPAAQPTYCMRASIPTIARWQAEHRGWRVVKWRCQTGRNGQAI